MLKIEGKVCGGITATPFQTYSLPLNEVKMNDTTKKKRSEKRQRKKIIPVRVSDDEKEMILFQANNCSLRPSTYLRRVGLKKRIKSTVDIQFFLDVCKIRGDLGRIGGLLKAWLSPNVNDIGAHEGGREYLKGNKNEINKILKSLELKILDVEEVVRKL
ncbi:MAG: hypothetical protein HUN04_12535 [Desulfobacter sp.]|nr:MAG: hypothetical protein HUN04_12535 [Desulfobacter sp.]